VAAPLTEEWTGRDVTVAQIERQLARLRQAPGAGGGASSLRTSVMTHCAWVPGEWLDAAESTLAGMNERHPSRTLILVPKPEEPDGLDADISIRCFPLGESHVCGEVIELQLRGNRTAAPASLVLPLAISDVPVFCRWRGVPPFGAAEWEQMVDVADRVVVDSSEWEDLAYGDLARVFERTSVSDIAWARTYEWRVELARYWPGIREQEVRIRGPRAEATLLRAWLNARLDRAIRPVEPAGELGVRLGGEELPAPRVPAPSPSDLLSAELDTFGRDRMYEEAVATAAAAIA
jgi:glucose-6-phosphate dehydrogenase assembly protein OpcA